MENRNKKARFSPRHTIFVCFFYNFAVKYLTKMEKRVIIIGASSGIGREVVLLFLKAGCRVGVVARREDRLRELADQYPERVEWERVDVTAADSLERLQALVDRLGGMDIYFHASGIGSQNQGLKPDIEDSTVQTNVVGFTRMVDFAFNYFAKQGGGQIGAITSIASTRGLGPAPSYSATKAFQTHYLEALTQLSCSRRLGITITDIRPGFVDTDLLAGDFHYPMKLSKEKVAKAIYRALAKKKPVLTIDWRYRLLVFFWRLVPPPIWRRIKLA